MQNFELDLLSLSSGELPLYIDGDVYFDFDLTIEKSGIIPIYTKCANLGEATIDLYTNGCGFPASGEIPVYTKGYDISSGDISVYTKGHLTTSGEMPTYTLGREVASGSMFIFTKGHVEIPLYTTGGGANGVGGTDSASIPLFVYNNQASGSTIVDMTMPLYCSGQPPVEVSASIPIYIEKPKNIETASIPIFLNTIKKQQATAEMPLYIAGALHSGVLGAVEANISLYLIGYYARRRVIQPTYEVETSGSIPMYVSGS